MNKSLWMGIGLFAAIASGGGLLLARPKDKTANQSVTPTPTAEGEIRQIEIIGKEYSFSPSTISLTKGKKVVLTFKNEGKMPHNLVIDELGLTTKTILGGQSDTIEFTPSEVGIFSFYCAISNHRSLGMEGSLEGK